MGHAETRLQHVLLTKLSAAYFLVSVLRLQSCGHIYLGVIHLG